MARDAQPPGIGELIIANDGLVAEAAAGVGHHHECMDGSGYPNGLRRRRDLERADAGGIEIALQRELLRRLRLPHAA